MKVNNMSIHDVLSKNNSSFFIPPFQRAYAWGHSEIDRFFDDIIRAIRSELDKNVTDKQEHFFGVLVFKTEMDGFASREVVVDGQQRLTSTLLLLIALRDAEKDEVIQRFINDTYLKNTTATFDEKIKLKQVTSDWESYKSLIQKTNPAPGKVTDGYNQFLSKIKKEGFSTKEYVTAINRINVACIFLDERPYKGEDPQIIFETLNSLGKPLTLADLIRNYVLLGMSSDDQTEIFDQLWHPKIENRLQEKSSDFFRDYLQYKDSKAYKVVNDGNTKELYMFFKDFVERTFTNNKKAFVKDICRFVPWYQWITEIDPTTIISKQKDNNQKIQELLRNIFHDIKADAFKPLVLGLLESHQNGVNGNKLTDEQFIEALIVIRTYLIRRRVLKLTQGENKDIPRLCSQVRENPSLCIDTTSEILKLLSRSGYRLRIPNDTEISDELKRIDFYHGLSGYSKFILGKIEEHESKVSVNFRDNRITIEHVMPQSIEKSDIWKDEIGSDWERIKQSLLNNIGNLILTEFNNEMGNKSFSEKKEKLRKSNMYYRNDVINRKTWNEADILEHQSMMIKHFLTTFPLPDEMQRQENWKVNNAETNQATVSPLSEDYSSIIMEKKPKSILIEGEFFTVTNWQTLFMAFCRWLKSNKQMVFEKVLNTRGDDLSGKYYVPATSKEIGIAYKNEPDVFKKYKRLSDGLSFSKINPAHDDEQPYIFINLSAVTFMTKIRHLMQIADMTKESVIIDLQPIRYEE